jgi:hypothetical protein
MQEYEIRVLSQKVYIKNKSQETKHVKKLKIKNEIDEQF